MATLDLDDDLTGQVKNALSEPISNPENSIRQQKVLTLLLASRIGRMERVAYWLVATIVAASATVVLSIIGASYALGARMQSLDSLAQRVEALEARER